MKVDLSARSDKHRWKSVVKDLLLLLLILLGVFAIWWNGWSWIDTNINPSTDLATNIAARGQFGDKFGAVNALFAGFAFAGIIFTIFLQNREIHQTKRMLEEQLKDSNKQRFDSTFFQLLTLHNDITAKLVDLESVGRNSFKAFNTRIIISDVDFPGYSALKKLDREEIRRLRDSRVITHEIKQKLEPADVSNLEAALETGVACCDNFLDHSVELQERKIKLAYTKAAELHVDNYSHYFRNLYHTLRFVKESPLIEDTERNRYAKIVRSQLSEPELLTLFYNSLTKIELAGREKMELGYPKMGRLLQEFDILQNLPPRSVLHPVHLIIFQSNYKAGV
ncbi:putative phage abortive infection protein [Pseudomonas cucumis]|uniref:putative phage abortive infection protein n=1 Tax=Pseudomonas cucumis TaxID=2954082 RepID=UPI00273661FC|nr:putative phage abortive infection protein [Pseudomonas cucumis]WLG91198.1 putative phage abortive infection protein [Pseudomonas cucumis]